MHVFRHSFAQDFVDAPGSEGDLMALAGWTSPSLVHPYERSAAQARARAAPIDG